MFFPFQTFAFCYIGSGFDKSYANGTYIDTGLTINSQPYYINENNAYLYNIYTDNFYWAIYTSFGGYDYYTWNPLLNTPAGGYDPNGSISEITCPSTSTPATTTTQFFIAGFSYGEILIILILIMIFSLIFFDTLKNWILGQKIEQPVKMKYDK